MPTVLSGIVESWGEKLLAGAFIYVLLVLAIALPIAPQNPELNKLVIPGTFDILRQSYETWNQLRGAVFSGSSITALAKIFNFIVDTSKVILTILGNIVVAYILLGFVISGFLPGPLVILRALIWVGAFAANTILLLYLLDKTGSVLSSLLGSLIPLRIG